MKEELYGLANHIAGAKGGLPQEWQEWADEIEMDIRKLANREAQPVGYIDPDSLKEYRGQRAGGTWSAVQRTTSGLNMTTPIYTAPPAPAIPDIGSSVVNDAAWKFYDTLTEHGPLNGHQFNNLKSCLYEALKIVMPAPPAPAVPPEATPEDIPQEHNINTYSGITWAAAWNACRAAMLNHVGDANEKANSPEIPDGWKLVPVEPTEDMIAAAMNCDDVEFNSDETFCVNFDNIYAAMLAAAPEGGNG